MKVLNDFVLSISIQLYPDLCNQFIETFDEMKEAASQTILEHKETNGMTESLNISARLTPRDSGLLSTKPSTTQVFMIFLSF